MPSYAIKDCESVSLQKSMPYVSVDQLLKQTEPYNLLNKICRVDDIKNDNNDLEKCFQRLENVLKEDMVLEYNRVDNKNMFTLVPYIGLYYSKWLSDNTNTKTNNKSYVQKYKINNTEISLEIKFRKNNIPDDTDPGPQISISYSVENNKDKEDIQVKKIAEELNKKIIDVYRYLLNRKIDSYARHTGRSITYSYDVKYVSENIYKATVGINKVDIIPEQID